MRFLHGNLYVRYFTQPLSQISQAVQSLQSAAAGERVFALPEAEEPANETEKPALSVKTTGAVSFGHVKFGCGPEKTFIRDFSADVKPGRKIAIVGPTGAAKRPS